MTARSLIALAIVSMLVACGEPAQPEPATDAGPTPADAGSDAGSNGGTDAGTTPEDAGTTPEDAGTPCTNAQCDGLLCEDAPAPDCAAVKLGDVAEPAAYWSLDKMPAGVAGRADSFVAPSLVGGGARLLRAPTFDSLTHRTPGRFTVSIWFRPNELPASGFRTVANQGNGPVAFTGWMLGFGADGAPGVYVEGGGGNEALVSGGSVCTDDWNHVAFTLEGRTAKLYVDGALVKEQVLAFDFVPGANPLRLGSPTAGSTSAFQGDVDEFALWDRALPAAQIQALYGAGACRMPIRAAEVAGVAYQAGASDVCAGGSEGGQVTFTCPAGSTITAVPFASYGTPDSCERPVAGSCRSADSQAKVEEACLGKPSCTFSAGNTLFGDPCFGTGKRFTGVVTCAPNP